MIVRIIVKINTFWINKLMNFTTWLIKRNTSLLQFVIKHKING